MDYGYSVNGWCPLSVPPTPYEPESIASDLTAAGYSVHPVGSTLEGAAFYLGADATEYPYTVDLTGVAGVDMVVWVHDFVSLTKLSQELGNLKTLLGIS